MNSNDSNPETGDRLVISRAEYDAVTRLDGSARFAYFVKKVANWESLWGLWEHGWAMYGTSDKAEAIALWPAREYALACAIGGWESFEPEELDLDFFLSDLASTIRSANRLVAVFAVPNDRGVVVTIDELVLALEEECMRY
ncbi:MAG: DUF2750 domain-containing protein [Planctomycetes bacterium]|nr:DUF2750 domain-containing protein [Planctomycetota bacterium]